jgi:chromosome segregation ATPase
MPTKAEMYENAEKIITGEWMFFRDEWASDIAKLIIEQRQELADSAAPSLGPPRLYIEQLRQQIAEFAQERGNFARTIFELRGIIEQGEAQTHEIGSLRDHSYKQADRIKELKEQIEAYRNYGSIKQKKVTRLREALKQVRSRVEHPRVYADVIDIIDEALAGASDEKDSKAAKELAVWLLRKDEVDRDMKKQVDSLWERTDIYVDLQEKQQEQIDALEGQASARAVCDEEHMLAIERRIDALEKRIDFHAVNNPLNGNPDDISLHELISVVDQRCALIEKALGGMTEEATFEKIDALEKRLYNIGLGD